MKKNYRTDTTCLNCSFEVVGKFCGNCGQENLETKEHVGHMLTHAIGDYFHFDSKFMRTMKPLLFQPGLLTNEYNAGKRTTYLPAIRMYIFISIVFFLAFSSNTHQSVNIGGSENSENSVSPLSITNNHVPQTVSEKKVAETRLENQRKNKLKKQTADEYAASQVALPEAKRDNYFFYYFKHKGLLLQEKQDIQEAFKDTLLNNLPKMMFLLLPLFALILMLIFKKSKFFYAEHFIYALHLHSFLYLFLLVPIFIMMVFSGIHWIIYWTVILGITLYIYKSLRTVYKNSRGKTIFKMLIMGTSYSVLLVFCLFLVVVGTFLMI